MSVSEDEVEGSSSIVDGIRWTQAELEPFCGVLVALATPLLLPQDADALYASLHTHKAVTLINRCGLCVCVCVFICVVACF